MDWKFEKNMYPILDTRVLIQNGVKPIFILLKFFKRLRTLVLWSDRDTYKFLIFKVFMMNDILFMTQYAL